MPANSTTNDCIDTYVYYLARQLRNMAHDILEVAMIDGASEYHYRQYMKDAVNFMSGALLCDKYLYGSLDLNEFCSQMIGEGLREMLIVGIPNLPDEIRVKYGLVSTSESKNNGVYESGFGMDNYCEVDEGIVIQEGMDTQTALVSSLVNVSAAEDADILPLIEKETNSDFIETDM